MDSDPASLKDTAIADVIFAFNNRDMLSLLSKRAMYLQSVNFNKATDVEREMTELKNSHYDRLVTPNTFFIVF